MPCGLLFGIGVLLVHARDFQLAPIPDFAMFLLKNKAKVDLLHPRIRGFTEHAQVLEEKSREHAQQSANRSKEPTVHGFSVGAGTWQNEGKPCV